MDADVHDFDRLELAISELVESHARFRDENARLRLSVDDGRRRIRTLETELLASNQRRQDAVKRIDELIAHLDQLDEQLGQPGD